MVKLILLSLLTMMMTQNNEPADQDGYQQATFGAGCFWCVEAIYQRVNGVISVESGYSGC